MLAVITDLEIRLFCHRILMNSMIFINRLFKQAFKFLNSISNPRGNDESNSKNYFLSLHRYFCFIVKFSFVCCRIRKAFNLLTKSLIKLRKVTEPNSKPEIVEKKDNKIYISANLGYAMAQNTDTTIGTSSGAIEYEPGFAGAAAVGFGFDYGRAEAEISYQRNGLDTSSRFGKRA
ncbi:MAG: hypothetical protein MZV70_24820 [Desulfobacterales bacterium]|nr:hypothetical protein [Desulfobacterales bacterium]